MPDDDIREADLLASDEDERLYGALERDARRYNKAFREEEEANGE